MENEKVFVNILNEILAENGQLIGFKKLSLENKATWLIESTTGNYILKMVAPLNGKNLIRKLIRRFRGSSRSFKTELLLLKNFTNIKYQFFKYPELIKYKINKYLLMEYIESKCGWDKKNITTKKMANAVLEFNISAKEDSFLSVRNNNRVIIKILYLSISKVWKLVGAREALSCIRVLIKSTLKQKKFNNSFMMHKDLIGNNNVLSSGGDLYFIDFESVILERRWILNDIIDVSLTKDLKVNNELVQNYLLNLEKCTHLDVELNIAAQFRVALLQRLIRRLFSKNEYSVMHREKWVDFLRNDLLSDKGYEKWYGNNVGIY